MSKKLNKLVIIVSIICFSTPEWGSAQQISTDQPLSLEECVQFALENNYTLQSTRLQEGIAETQVGETRAMGLPQASVRSNINYNYEVQKAFLPNALFGPDTTSNEPFDPEGFTPVQFSPNYDGNATFSVSQLIFDGSYFVGLQAAKTLRELRQKETNQSEIETVEAVTKAYYTVLINQERSELVDANINQLEELLNDTRALNENGFAESIEVDRVQVNLNNTKTEKNKIQRGLNYAMDLLKFQMGLPLSEEITLSGDVKNLSLNVTEYATQIEQFNYEQRVDYRILKTNKELSELDLKNNKATHLPKLSANFSYGYNTGVNEFSELWDFNNNWLSFGAVGISLQWDLFTGLRRSNLMQRNRIQIEQLDIQKEALEKSIDLEIRQLRDNLRSAKESLEVQEANKKLANKVFEQSQIKYNNGVGSSNELIEAETARKTAETNYYNALYDAVITQIELEKALGTLY
ncbi:transporter [Marivirga lumbricoides]|uniref:Transporter n=1 Tax=Marivirga lumbricoides TaxID=1046115 RepID=A0ABQ1M749_9BACT|nr:transporter [Marivirga lumbricoides]